MGLFSSIFDPGKGYRDAQDELNKYYQQGQGYLNPYNQQGQQQGGNLNTYINSLMDPAALQDKWAKGYTESGAAKQAEGLAQQHGLDAASSLGLMGSGTALDAIQSGTSNIAMQDRQNYMNDLMQKYMQGAGLSQGMYNTGAGAAGQMSNNAMNQGQNSAQMRFGEANDSGLIGSLLGKFAGGAGGVIGGRMMPK